MPKNDDPYIRLNGIQGDSLEDYSTVFAEIQKILKKDVPQYDPQHMYIEKQSFHPDDWYLWSVAARKRSDPDKYGVWTANLSLSGLYNGHYDVPVTEVTGFLNEKRR